MSQTESGIKSILKIPFVYSFFTDILGVKKARKEILGNHVRAKPGERLLDIGCGPAQVVEYIKDIDYYGFDSNPEYIEAAKHRWGDKGTFICGDVSGDILETLPEFDIVMASGVLHHLDDEDVIGLCKLANKVLVQGGRLVTGDVCYADGQSTIARMIADRDRGRNVRTVEGYTSLVSRVFDDIKTDVRLDLLRIPNYSVLIIECKKPSGSK